MQIVLITGCAGFIGHHLSLKYLELGYNVVGIDSLREDISSTFKEMRLAEIQEFSKTGVSFFDFKKSDIRNLEDLKKIFEQYSFSLIVHLAARTGVRESSTDYTNYFEANTIGTCNLLECNKQQKALFLFASSSSVYGNNTNPPFQESQEIAKPLSLYAVTKITSELIAFNYAHNHNIPIIGLRFFTVYGPWSRPDMAVYMFFQSISQGKEITLYNGGELERDFTYVGDIVNGILKLGEKYTIPENKLVLAESQKPEIFNIGFGTTRKVKDLVACIEKEIGKKAIIENKIKMVEDMESTHSDTSKLFDAIEYMPEVSLEEGIHRTALWYERFPVSNI